MMNKTNKLPSIETALPNLARYSPGEFNIKNEVPITYQTSAYPQNQGFRNNIGLGPSRIGYNTNANIIIH